MLVICTSVTLNCIQKTEIILARVTEVHQDALTLSHIEEKIHHSDYLKRWEFSQRVPSIRMCVGSLLDTNTLTSYYTNG